MQLQYYAQQLRLLHCPVPVIAHAGISGDTTFGGIGISITCNAGYESNLGFNIQPQYSCTDQGLWGPVIFTSCVLADACISGENDCDRNAICSHLGPGQHSCECDGNGFTGDGEMCHPCNTCSVGEVETAACTSATDTVRHHPAADCLSNSWLLIFACCCTRLRGVRAGSLPCASSRQLSDHHLRAVRSSRVWCDRGVCG